MRTVCFINGSPKAGESMSHYFIENIEKMLGDIHLVEIRAIDVLKKKNYHEAFSSIVKADALVFVFPLYIDSIPSSLLEFLYALNDYTDKIQIRNTKIPRCYAVVNEGFFGGTQNVNAINNIRHFCNSAGFSWRFGVGIGAGEYLGSSKDIPLNSKSKIPVYNALKKVTDDILHNTIAVQKNIFADPKLTKRLFILSADIFWIFQAKKNGLRLSELKAKPFSVIEPI